MVKWKVTWKRLINRIRWKGTIWRMGERKTYLKELIND